MMRDSAPPRGERPGLEDVAEEEDVFAGMANSRSPQEPGVCEVRVPVR